MSDQTASHASDKKSQWQRALDIRVVHILLLGFAAGLPILLIFSSLSLWLGEVGLKKSTVTMFSWAALGYSFKFIWAPIVDAIRLPLLNQWLGHRRSWLLVSQVSIIIAIVWMAMTNPADGDSALTLMAFAAVLLGFSSATQDIVIDAYRIEIADADLQALLSSAYISGYRIAMVVAGAGVLFLADGFGTNKDNYVYSAWQNSYLIMALIMGIGVLTTLWVRPTQRKRTALLDNSQQAIRLLFSFILCVIGFIMIYIAMGKTSNARALFFLTLPDNPVSQFVFASLRLLIALGCFYMVAKFLVFSRAIERNVLDRVYAAPILEWWNNHPLKIALLLLLLIGLYRISDIVLGVISNVYYQDLGYSKTDIAWAVKTFGLWMSIAGGILGGVLAVRFGVMRILLLGAVLSMGTNLLFIVLNYAHQSQSALYAVVGADNIAAGLASAAFIAFLSALTDIRFTAVQYAIFSSLMTLLPKLLGGYSGTLVEAWGYDAFFMFTAAIGIPVIILIVWLHMRVKLGEFKLAG